MKKRRKKRGSYRKHKPKKYDVQVPFKTTTLEGKKLYQRRLMRERRGTPPSRFFSPGRPRKLEVLARKAKKIV